MAPSASNDLAFTQSIVDAVDVIVGRTRQHPTSIAVTDGTFVVDDAAAAIRDYASQGYDLVIAHGSQYGGSLEEIAPDFPETCRLPGVRQPTRSASTTSSAYEAASDEGGYVMGVMAAAAQPRPSTIGIVGPVEVGDAKLYVDGFKAGAEANGSARP